MEHRFNYFQQNPNSLVNGQSAFNRPSADGIQSTNNYSGSIPSTSSSDQSTFHEKMHSNPNTVPLMNNHLYQMDSGNQPPRSSGPPRTNAKGIYENSQSSIPNVLSLTQSNNAENYTINPDFQLQPHLTALLPQQSKRVPELYPVDKYNTSKGSIAENMNTNYFSSNKPYPEPKIIEYDLEETSTESSPQHTSSLYSESTDQDSESIHANNIFPRHMLSKSTECHVTKESKTISTPNQEFPVPSQFADFNLKKDDSVDDHQHSILHSAYNQDDDIIEDIPLFDNINPNEREPGLENQENIESRFNEQNSNIPIAQTFDSYATKKDFEQTKFNYENKQGSSSVYGSMTNYLSYNVDKSSNAQNSSQFNKGLYFNQANTLTQSSSSNSSILQQSQRKPIFPYSNTELFNYQESSTNQNFNDDFNAENFNQQIKHIQPDIQKSNVPPVDSLLQYNINSKTPDKIVPENDNIKTSSADTLKYQTMNSSATSMYNQHSEQGIESINQQSIYNSSKPPVSELLNNSQPTASKEFIAHDSSLISTQSFSPVSSATIAAPLSSFSASEAKVHDNQNTQYKNSDDQTNSLLNLSNIAKNSSIDLLNQDSTKVVQSEIDTKLSQSPISSLLENQHETTVDRTKPINMKLDESQHDEVKSMSPSSIKNVTQSHDLFNPKNMTSQLESKNQFTSQQSTNDDIKTSYDQFSKNVGSQSINNQNVTVNQSISTTGHSVSNYFDSSNVNNTFLYNQQSCNLQSSNQLQNMQRQDQPIVSINPTSDKSNNYTAFSNAQNALSSNQHSLLTKDEFEIAESSKLNSDVSSKETLHSSESLMTQSNDLNFESLENAEIVTPNDQFSNMTIDKQQNMSDNKIHTHEQSIPTSYFSKDISLDKEEHSIAFKNFSNTFQDNNSSAIKLEVVNKSQMLQSEQTNLKMQSLNSDIPTNQEISPQSNSNQIVPNNKIVGQLEGNQFPPQHFSNKVTSNEILSSSNQLPSQIFNNQPKLNTIQPLQSVSNAYTTQPFNNQPILNTVSSPSNQLPPNMFDNQSKPNTTQPLQSASNLYTTQSFNNQPTLNTVSSASNQLPPKMFDNQPKPDTVQPLQSTSNLYTTRQFDNQQTPTTIPSVSNQFPPQMLNNQPISNTVPSQFASSSYPTPTASTATNLTPAMFSNQPISNTVPSQFASSSYPTPTASTATNLTPAMFSNQPISSAVPPPQFISSSYPTSIVSTATNLTPAMFSNQPISNTVPPSQFISSSYSTSTASTVTNQLPPALFSNQSTSNTAQPLQSASNLYPTQVFNNQSKPVTVPSMGINQFPPQNLDNQPKSMIMSHNQTVAKTPVNQSTLSSAWPSSATNQFQPQIFNGQIKSDVSSFQTLSNQYTSQPFNNKTMSNMVPPVPSAASQLPSQSLSNQPKSNVGFIQSTTGQNSFQPFNNQHTPTAVSSAINQLPTQLFSNQPKSNVVAPLQTTAIQHNLQALNNQQTSNFIPPVPSTTNQFSSQIFTNQPKLDSASSNKLTTSQYQSQPLINQSLSSSVPPIQQATNQYPSQPFSHQSKPSNFPTSQTVKNQYPSQPFTKQPGQQVLSKQNLQQSSNNQFSNQSNSIQPVQNQWPPANFSSQNTNLMSSQPITNNSSSNMSTMPPSVNQQSQMLGTHMLPPNPLTSNNYYNQVEGIGNIQQPQSSNHNVQLATKGYPPQNNMGFSSQTNYQQPNVLQRQQDPYRPDQNPSVLQQGFSKTWGYDNLDLLKSRDVLPGDGVQPPEIKLPQGYANCDNCSPDIFRCTLNKFPVSKNLLDKSRLPLGILIHPYKDLSRLTVIQCETITRCRNCRSYINPFVQFIDNAHWKCNLCYRVNELPGEFQIDPYTKTLGDPSRRPEIQNATIEYIASQDYMVRPPQPALYLFLLDVSRTATLTGYLEIVCDRILNKIMADDIPGDSRTNIGFITYDSSVHFYQIANSDGGQPKQLIVSDISDIFLPLPDGLMVNLEENKMAIKDLLTNLPNTYRESYNTGCALGAALQAAFKILAPRGGRVTVFQASLPNCGPGKLEPRDDGNPHTGDRVQHTAPSTDFYKKLALECSGEQIAVDMFFVSSQYLDIATISGISKYSSGCIHNFPQFNVKSPTIVTRFINCFDRYLSRKIGFEALLRLRCTRGVAIHSFHGNFFVRSSDLLMLPNVNPDNAYGMQLSIEDSLDGVSVVCFQAALLYTSSNAERRIRVHTLCIPVTENLDDVFHNADQQAITCLIAKMAVDRSTEKSLSDAREAFFNAISDSLSAYKLGCSSFSGPGTMLSPLSLKVFPLYILATLKHAAFRTNQPTRLDERMFSMCQMKSLPLNNLIQYIYPDLYPIYALEEQPKIDYEKLTEIPLPPVIQLSAERVESNGVYLMDDSETLTIFIGHRCSDKLIQQLFGYVNVNSMPELVTTLAEVDSRPSYLLRSFISYLQHFKPYPLPIEIIKDNGPHKLRFYSRLVEDKFESSLSYYEFLQRLSQQVR
ncbi:mucin-12 isoform X1 [Aphis gossypii]|uniref:mucin-12 isoform X1 n=1 Tax=Aphis gossypii TaxID=80765 RepID=UPI002158AE02|nr:mucin-12 isoform X1 [Aphis gossypii]